MFRIVTLFSTYVVLAMGLSSCSPAEESAPHNVQLKNAIGQKLMLDFRYFCHDDSASDECQQAVTELPDELAQVLSSGAIGGVILFAENIETIPQTMTLIDSMQQVMKANDLPPLFIALDQEGGRVARLPDSMATRFSGNMAIGATYPVHETEFAEKIGRGIGRAVKLLGFNVNFAPTVDVNVNPQNPVINVRSYGEHPATVAALGQATVRAMQAEGVMSALKHFPGHGDTHTDSHTGLPRVAHDRATVDAVDLLPFAKSIASNAPPAMIMTAHIQYPELDDTTFISTDGEPRVVPATMSRKILTQVLRDELGYQGVVITDALDMAGIAHYFDPLAATLQTFKAGADIALMPYTIRNNADIEGFWQFFDGLTQAAQQGELDNNALQASAERIAALKASYQIDTSSMPALAQRIADAEQQLPLAENKQLERELAAAAVTQVYDRGVLPVRSTRWQLIMPDNLRCRAFQQALMTQQPNSTSRCLSLSELPKGAPWQQWDKNATLVIGDITPHHSLAEMGGMDDLNNWRDRPSKAAQHEWIRQALVAANAQQQTTIVVALRAPYMLSQFQAISDAGIASYDYSTHPLPHEPLHGNGQTQLHAPSIEAVVAVLLGADARGQLPVTVGAVQAK